MLDSLPPDDLLRKPSEGMTFIYVLIDPRDNAIRYVGKSDDPQHRLGVHMSEREKVAPHKSRWVAQLKKLGLRPLIYVIEEVPQEKWQEREIYWIDFFRDTLGCDLTNIAAGGIGVTLPPESRAKIADALRGKKLPPEHVEKIAAGNRGKKRTPEQRERVAAANRGAKRSPEARASMAAAQRGKKQPPEQIAKRVEKLRGRKWTPEMRAKFSEEQKQRFAVNPPRRGQKHSASARAKQSEARRQWHARRRLPPPDSPTLWD